MKTRTKTFFNAVMYVGLVATFGKVAVCQERDNFDLLAQLKEADFTAFAVANNTVFLGQGSELVAVDMSTPARPVELARRPFDSGTTAGAILTNGQYLFARTASRGLQVYNVSNPRSLAYVGRFAPYDTYRPAAMAVEDSRLYFGGQRFRIFDVSNPSSPTKIADLPYLSSRMAVSQGRALLTGGNSTPVKVYDVRDAANPAFLGEFTYSSPSWHEEIAMRWPTPVVAINGAWTEWHCSWPIIIYCFEFPVSWSALDAYSPSYDGGWNSLELGVRQDRHFSKIVVTADKVFTVRPGELAAFDSRSLGNLSAILGEFTDLAVEGNSLYGLGRKCAAVYDAGSSPTFPLRGAWDAIGGSVVALGNGRAYVLGKVRGISTVDVRTSSAPRMIGKGPMSPDARAATVAGQCLYVADAEMGLRVLSLANPDRPQEVRVAKVAGGAMDVVVSGDKAYVGGGQELLRIFNLTNPTSPVTMGVLPPYQSYNKACAIAVAGNNAYLLATTDETGTTYTRTSQLLVINVHDPHSPRVIGSHIVNDWSGDWGGDLAVVGNSLFVINARPPAYAADYTPPDGPVFDISNPTSPTVVGKFTYGSKVTLLTNKWALVTNGPHGLDAYMIANPRHIVANGFVAADAADVATLGELAYTVSESEGFGILRLRVPDLSDLVPRDFSLAPTSVAPNQPLNFSGYIENIGPEATTQSFWVRFAGIPTDRTGPIVSLCDWLQIPAGLAPGTSVSLAGAGRTLYAPDKGVLPGKYMVAISVDETNVIAEIRKDNNIAVTTGQLTVLVSPNDLRPTEFRYAPDTIRDGQTITLSGRIEYTGTQTTTKGFWVEFWCSPNADVSPPRHMLCSSLWVGPGLAPGTAYTFSIPRTVYGPAQGLPSGLYVVQMVVDSTNAVPEKSETNNTLHQSALRLLIRDPRTGARHWEKYW